LPKTNSRLFPTHHQEEDGHQPIVDPQDQRLVQIEGANREADARLPDLGECRRPAAYWRV
jgi:hypothetical protein